MDEYDSYVPNGALNDDLTEMNPGVDFIGSVKANDSGPAHQG